MRTSKTGKETCWHWSNGVALRFSFDLFQHVLRSILSLCWSRCADIMYRTGQDRTGQDRRGRGRRRCWSLQLSIDFHWNIFHMLWNEGSLSSSDLREKSCYNGNTSNIRFPGLKKWVKFYDFFDLTFSKENKTELKTQCLEGYLI